MPHRDGTNGSGADAAYLKNTPIEITEAEVPIQILRYGLLPDSGGAGRWRGGLATALDFRVSAPHTRITARNRDRSRFRPWGILGGQAGQPSDFILNPGTARERVLGNTDTLACEPGDVIHIHSPGGGGRGSPLDREPERVALDVERGYVTLAAALRDYGVVIKNGTIDASGTTIARAATRAGIALRAGIAHFAFGPEREAHEAIWTEAVYADMTVLLAGLPVHWRFFVKGKLFALMPKPGAPAATVAELFAKVQAEYSDVPTPRVLETV